MQQGQTPRRADKKKERIEWERLLRLLMAALVRFLENSARALLRGELSAIAFMTRAHDELEKAHRQARLIGERYAGLSESLIAFSAFDTRIAQEQTTFLTAFTTDLKAGRYDPKSQGGSGAAARKARFQLYANRLVGTANQGWLSAILLTGEQVRWQLGANEEHCKDCKYESEQGFRHPSELTRVPGDGTTFCITNCRCKLITEDGLESFHL